MDDEDEEETKQNSWDFPIPPQFCVLINPVDFQSFSWTEGEIIKLSSFSKRERDAMADGGSSLEAVGPLGGLSGLPNLGMDFNGKLDNPQERIKNFQLKQPKVLFPSSCSQYIPVDTNPNGNLTVISDNICESLSTLLCCAKACDDLRATEESFGAEASDSSKSNACKCSCAC